MTIIVGLRPAATQSHTHAHGQHHFSLTVHGGNDHEASEGGFAGQRINNDDIMMAVALSLKLTTSAVFLPFKFRKLTINPHFVAGDHLFFSLEC